MRPLLPVLLLLASLGGSLASVPVQAQAEAAPFLEDPAGDVMLRLADQEVGSASNVYPMADLRSLSIQEDSTSFTWVLGVADVRSANEETGVDGVRFTIAFAHNGRFFQLLLVNSLPSVSGPAAFVNLQAADALDGPYANLWSSFVTGDAAANTFTVAFTRDLLADADGAAPFPGRLLEGITAEAKSAFSGNTLLPGLVNADMPQDVQDVMPNAGGAPGTYAVQVGVQQTGHARLSSEQPFRASNGEATTFVYEVDATNTGDANESFELTVTGAPARVDVVVPVPLLAIPAGATLRVPILATIPFGHQHGGVDNFLAQLTSLSDPGSVGRLEMGIRYLAVPQPAGHHDTLWLHLPKDGGATEGLLDYTPGFMNTMDQDERAGTAPWHATGLSSSGTTFYANWLFELSPGLEIGIDLDGQRTGRVSIPVQSTLPLLGATLSGDLYISEDESGFGFGNRDAPLASFATGAVDIDANGKHTFEADLKPENSQRLPAEPGRNLFLSLLLEYTAIPAPLLGLADESPAVAPGGFMQVPLNEWHDDVDDALNAVGGPVLQSLGPQERLVNAGEALVFQAAMTNPTDQDIPVGFEVTGKNKQWASLPVTKIVLPANGNLTVSMVVRPPPTAVDEERADLVLQVYPQEMPELRALLRLVAIVDSDADHADEAPLATELEKKESPVPPLAAVAALALALAVVARRRP